MIWKTSELKLKKSLENVSKNAHNYDYKYGCILKCDYHRGLDNFVIDGQPKIYNNLKTTKIP